MAARQDLQLRDVVDVMKPAPGGQFTTAQDELIGKFYELYPFKEAEDALNAFLKRGNCSSCRTTLMTIMAQRPDQLQQFINAIDWGKMLGRKPLDIRDTLPGRDAADAPTRPVPARPSRPVSIAGQTRDIDDTPEAYKAMLETINGHNGYFSGFAIRVLPDGHLRFYFH